MNSISDGLIYPSLIERAINDGSSFPPSIPHSHPHCHGRLSFLALGSCSARARLALGSARNRRVAIARDRHVACRSHPLQPPLGVAVLRCPPQRWLFWGAESPCRKDGIGAPSAGCAKLISPVTMQSSAVRVTLRSVRTPSPSEYLCTLSAEEVLAFRRPGPRRRRPLPPAGMSVVNDAQSDAEILETQRRSRPAA